MTAISFSQGTLLRHANLSDIEYVESLRNIEANALGFIPIQSYTEIIDKGNYDLNRLRWQYSEILITEDNKEKTGFCYVSYARKSGFRKDEYAHIFQIVIQKDARRLHRALMIIDYIIERAKAKGMYGIKSRVAVDLESNFFWKAVGFIPVFEMKSTWLNQKASKTKRPLYLYVKEFDNDLFGRKNILESPNAD